MGARRRTTAPALVAGAVGLLVAASIALWARGPQDTTGLVEGYAAAGAMWTLAFGGIGALVLRDSPGNRLGPLFAAIGLWLGVGGFCGALRGQLDPSSLGYALCSVVDGLWLVVVPALFLIPVLYPDGRPLTARWRIPARTVVACIVTTATASLLAPEITESEAATGSAVNPFGVESIAPAPLVIAVLSVLISVTIGIAALVAQMLRARRLEGDERARVGWLIAFFTAQLVALLLTGVPNLAVQLLAAICLGIGVLRHHLFDIQRVLSRSVTYALLVAVAMAVALATAAAMGSLSSLGVLPALAAAVTAVVLASWFTALQRVVDRWVYGPHQDPAEALELLGDRLAAAADPDDVLPRVVDTVRESLGLPYAALTLTGETERAAVAGAPEGPTVTYPLRYGGQAVGRLELGLRVGDADLSAREARLVSTFAAQAGTAAHSAQVLRELRRSREQLVTAREEERRMLRRDLHDGLGPTLAGMTLGLESLQRGTDDPGEADLAAELVAQSRLALDAVRRLSRDLRPPPLDELGLTGALRQHAALVVRMTGGHPDVSVVVDGAIPELPAAVEVAAYRITQEAVSNATRHAAAASCVVALSANGSLQLSVTDDGSGAAPLEPGTGLRSMRERADELGGSCTVTFQPGTGTVVRAVLPLGLAREPWSAEVQR